MSGDIYVVSALGAGARFTAVLCLKRGAESADRIDRPLSWGAAPHVLLALDRAIERRALRLSLQGVGIPVEECTRADASALIRAVAGAGKPFTTVLLDYHGGCEAAAQLLKSAREAAPGRSVQGLVVLDTAVKADFADFRATG